MLTFSNVKQRSCGSPDWVARESLFNSSDKSSLLSISGRTERLVVDDVTGACHVLLLPGVDVQYHLLAAAIGKKGEGDKPGVAEEVTTYRGEAISEEKVFRTLPYVNCEFQTVWYINTNFPLKNKLSYILLKMLFFCQVFPFVSIPRIVTSSSPCRPPGRK